MTKLARTQRLVAVSALVLALAASALAAPPLFPEPLHLTRVIEDPVTGDTSTVEEYCHGSSVVSISGDRTVIADYAKQTITTIDRAEGTYSVAKFEQLAAANTIARKSSEQSIEQSWAVRSIGARRDRGNAEYVEAQPKQAREVSKMEIGVDRGVRLTRDAAEVLAGAAYPRVSNDASELVLRASAPSREKIQPLSGGNAATADSYGLPVEQIVTFDFEGKRVTFSNRVTRIGREMPPVDKTTIPPGARLIPPAALEAQRALEEADTLPTSPTSH